jgi:hypothetical protein
MLLRTAVLLAMLVARLAAGLGPESVVLCVHEGAQVEVESSSEACCAKPSCAASRSQVVLPPEPGGEDDCQDYAFARDEWTGAPAPELPQPELAAGRDVPALALLLARDSRLRSAQSHGLSPPPRAEALETHSLRF